MREELLVSSFTQGNGDTAKSSNLPNITQLGFKLKCLEPSLLTCLPSPCSSQLLGSCTCGQSVRLVTHCPPHTCVNSHSVPKHSTPSSSWLFKLYVLVKAKFKPYCAHKAVCYLLFLGVLTIISVSHCSLLHVTPLFFNCP